MGIREYQIKLHQNHKNMKNFSKEIFLIPALIRHQPGGDHVNPGLRT